MGSDQLVHKIDNDIESLITLYNPKHVWLVYLGQFNLDNLDLSAEELNIIKNYNKIKDFKPKNNLELFRIFSELSIETILLYAITVDREIAINYLEKFSKIKIETTGNDLQKLGIKQGKIYNEIFNFLTEQKLLNSSITKQDEFELIKKRFL